ncbi:MAG: NAD-binding protein [Anaerolineae bacterium]|nr:NAD-binding protein [Anaerolineae bacterium]
MKQSILIVGGGKTGSYLAALLLKSGCNVRVVENRPYVFERLSHELPAPIPVLGDGTDPGLLEQIGVASMDVIAAVTGDDETNLVAASLAKFEYRIRRVIVRINNPRNAWLCTPEMGVDVAINQADLMATLIVEEISVGDMQTLVRLRQGAVEIVEEAVSPNSKAVNKPIAALTLPSDCNITAIIRGSEVIIPSGSTILQAGDEIVAVVRSDNRQALEQALA